MGELIAVTGANGWIGKEVCKWLDAKSVKVRRVSRASGGPELTAAGSAEWAAAFGGCRTVVHCAAHVHQPGKTPREQQQFREINVRGTERVLAGCELAGVERFVFVSTLAVYDRSVRGPWDEEMPLLPSTAYGQSKAEGESHVRHSCLRWRIARLGTVFGVGDRANFFRLASALRRGRFLIPGTGAARKSVISIEQAGEVLGRLSLLDSSQGVLVNSAMPEAPSLAQVCGSFAELCGFSRPARIPLPLLRVAARLGDLAGGRAPLNTEVLGKLTTDTVVNVDHLQSILPAMHWRGFREALAPAASYYAAAGNEVGRHASRD